MTQGRQGDAGPLVKAYDLLMQQHGSDIQGLADTSRNRHLEGHLHSGGVAITWKQHMFVTATA
jgi:hypothetical protein